MRLPLCAAATVYSSGAAPAREVVGQFWSGMLVAQVFVAWWVLRIGVRRLALGTSVGPPVTSGIAALASPLRVLQFSSGCYLAVALLLIPHGRPED